jgi:hypothetical protein
MSKTQIKAYVDSAKNRLYLTLSGKIDAPSLEKLYTEVRFAVADLKPGFEVVNDISRCQLIYVAGLPVFKKIIDYLLVHKAGEIVRIIDKDNISCRQILSFTDQINSYQPLYVDSSEHAEQQLDSMTPRGGIRLKLRHLRISYDSPAGSGEAKISDISISGCGVCQATLVLPVGTDFEGHIAFPSHPPLIGQVQLKATVVRTSDDGFGAKFLGISQEFREQLYLRLLHEACQSAFNRRPNLSPE